MVDRSLDENPIAEVQASRTCYLDVVLEPPLGKRQQISPNDLVGYHSLKRPPNASLCHRFCACSASRLRPSNRRV
jgi:hypothetical protein